MVQNFKIMTIELKNVVDFCMFQTEENIMKHNMYKINYCEFLAFSN